MAVYPNGRGHGGGRGVGANFAAGCGQEVHDTSFDFLLQHTLLFYGFRPHFVKSYYEKFYGFICDSFPFLVNRPLEPLLISFCVIDWSYLPAKAAGNGRENFSEMEQIYIFQLAQSDRLSVDNVCRDALSEPKNVPQEFASRGTFMPPAYSWQ